MAQADEVGEGSGALPDVLPPIVIDCGKMRRKRIKQLRRGRGRLMDEVRQVVGEIRARLGEEAQDKEFIPIVLVYRKKSNRERKGFLSF